MIDGWIGDDWFHDGAFRQVNLDYFTGQSSKTGKGDSVPRWSADDYQNFLDAGSAGNWAIKNGFQQLPFWNRLSAHPAYDAFWQDQALDTLVLPIRRRSRLYGFKVYGITRIYTALSRPGRR